MQKFKIIKPEIRILAWDDGPFEFRGKGKCILIGTVFRGGQFMDGLLRTDIDIDGEDAEEKIIEKTNKMKYKDVRIIMLDGITFAGFNTVDIKNIYEKTKLPVIVINRKKPDFEKFISTLEKLPNSEKRIRCVKSAGTVYWVKMNGKRICFQCTGLNIKDAEEIIKTSATRSIIPEPLRIAHIIATGIILEESVGRA